MGIFVRIYAKPVKCFVRIPTHTHTRARAHVPTLIPDGIDSGHQDRTPIKPKLPS